MKKSLLCFAVLVFGMSVPAQAGLITTGLYILEDHPDAYLFKTDNDCCNQLGAPGPYGLRMDSLEGPGVGPTFSVSSGGASMMLNWDGVTAVMSGQVRHNSTGALWDVDYTLSMPMLTPDGVWFTEGEGTLSMGGTSYDLFGKAPVGKTNVFDFFADGWRLAGDNMTPVARGWIVPICNNDNTVAFVDDGCEGSTNDWLVRARKVPEPATLLLFGSGVTALALRRRK